MHPRTMSTLSTALNTLYYQVLNFGMIVSSALMIWKGLMVVTGSESPIVVVLSGSMEPAFHRGDLLFLTNRVEDPIRVGEIVVFRIEGREIPIVHRVLKIHEKFVPYIGIVTILMNDYPKFKVVNSEKMGAHSEDGFCKYTLFCAFIMLFNISLSTSVSLDLTELRNKVSKIKVHPRGNLWATGHFMGKKSISSSQLQDSGFPPKLERNIEEERESSEDLKELISQTVLKVALQAQLQDPERTQETPYNQDSDFVVKLLKDYVEKLNL
ncbi:hypothetical protein DNTS_031054 [Danionella cerebrum]|uniref:Signal peptidase complex catalytic subunit SEC11 n=1 Tax=Danionella cerebrum TaxID=2873325 RepID=A0A553MYP3_9TELE|nr:hypothetical protein DNTS_031054 [Danionella translucida]